jgi:hypothetical protein
MEDDAASNIYNRRLLKKGIDADEHNKHDKKYVDRSLIHHKVARPLPLPETAHCSTK